MAKNVGVPASDENRAQIGRVWIDYWEGRETRDEEFELIRFRQILLDELDQEVGRRPGREARILNAGCGLDPLPAVLLPRHPGIEITLLDISPRCLEVNRRYLEPRLEPEARKRLHFIPGDLFNLPWKDEHFDVIYHTGVLEHFSERDQIAILSGIAGALKVGGAYISLNPCRRGSLYLFMKRYWERTGKWSYGPEFPLRSLRQVLQRSFGSFVLTEKNLDFWQTAAMLSAHDRPALAKLGERLLRLTRIRAADWLLLKTFGGYILLSRVRKTG